MLWAMMTYLDLYEIEIYSVKTQSQTVLFHGLFMIPIGTVSLEVENNNHQRQITEVLQFQVVKGSNKL